MPLRDRNHMRQFLLFVFVLLIPCFALWTFLSASLVTPVIGLVHLILSSWFPEVVNVVYQQGADAILLTRFDQIDGQLVQVGVDETGLGFTTNTRIISYSIPFFAALHFATEKKDYLGNFFWGVLILYPFILLGIICICMKDLMVVLGLAFLEQPGVWVPAPDVIAIMYQLNVLIFPTLLPAVIWAWQSRDTVLLRGFFPEPGTVSEDGH